MKKLYHKSCDINGDIKKYKRMLRNYKPGSKEHKDIAKEIKWLNRHKENLSKRNRGNAGYWHNGIPPAEVKKSKPLSEQAKRQKKRQFLEEEIKFFKDRNQAITGGDPDLLRHLNDLENQLNQL